MIGETGPHICRAEPNEEHDITGFDCSVDRLDKAGLKLYKDASPDVGSMATMQSGTS